MPLPLLRAGFAYAVPVALAFALAAPSGGCGGRIDTTITTNAAGAVGGVSLPVGSSLAEVEPVSSSASCASGPNGSVNCSSSSTGQVVAVLLTNIGGLSCETLGTEDNVNYKNAATLVLTVANATASVTPGTYVVLTGDAGSTLDVAGAGAEFTTTTASCGDGLDLNAIGGTVTLTAVSDTNVQGTFDVTFASGAFSGAFDVDICVVPDTGNGTSSGMPLCM